MPIHNWSRSPVGLYHHFHQRWIAALCDALNSGLLPKGYFALTEQSTGGVIPDLLTLERPASGHSDFGHSAGVLTSAPPRASLVEKTSLEQYAHRANLIAVHHSLGDVVAVIEIVSPGNKSSTHALRSFVDKSIGLLLQGVHLSFVDLFPPGRRDPRGLHQLIWSELSDSDFSPPADRPLSMVGYCAGDQVAAYVETAAVGEMFPDVPLFLTPTGHIVLPLNETYSTTWNTCPEPLRVAVEGGSPS